MNKNTKKISIDEDCEIKLVFNKGIYSSRISLEHDKPNIKSNILIKAIVDKNDVFNIEPIIVITRNAFNVDTYLRIEVLLLDEQIDVKVIPSMEIEQNDIRASHSVKISSIDKNDIYYLNTKGLDPMEAEKILIDAFLNI